MKKSFVYKVTKAALWVLHVFGASAFLLTVMALCGVPMNFWVGVCTVLPGWLIIKGLLNLCGREIMKAMENGTHERFVIVKDGKDEDCRFNEDGHCTFGDGLAECAHEAHDDEEEDRIRPFEGKKIVSCEDESVEYLEFRDGIRMIYQDGVLVGWYRCEGGGKDA